MSLLIILMAPASMATAADQADVCTSFGQSQGYCESSVGASTRAGEFILDAKTSGSAVPGSESSGGIKQETLEERYARTCGSRCGDLYVATVIRATDFESFRPRKPIALSEPVSWAAVGLPANFYAEIEPHTIEGTLLGRPAVARFTPASYRWNFGDGHSLTTRGKGSQWKTQSLKEFSDTATSHTFDRPGDYSVTLTVNYSIEYYYEENADGGWEEFIGYLPIASEPIPMHVASVKTVLVSKTCLQNPTGPGC
ncbi:PKD domain-containing protein [Salinibacterium hongtaonis]|uniref:PKD domain-containing protein n=1 Tax=Homoserinimonas hongtaonis TaxID=2079791 RepID=UPI00131ED4B7|nr:PKD domain-containing protein [Salinibacterium hongtaonis]